MPDTATFIRDFDLVGLSGILRVLGVCAFMSAGPKTRLPNDLPLVLSYVQEVFELYRSDAPIAAFSEWFEAEVMPRIEDQEWYHRHA